MKKSHKTVLFFLVMQVVFGGLLMYGAFTENSSSDAIVVAIPLYLGLALGFTIFSVLRYTFSANQELRGAYRNCITATILLWLLAWPTFLYAYELASRL